MAIELQTMDFMDFRYALRTLAKTPSFTFVAVLTLALGIGINTVVFTFYESVVWKPLAVRAPGQIIRVYGVQGDGQRIEEFSYSDYTQLRDHNRSFASVVATSTPQSALCTIPGGKPEDAEVVHARLVSDDYFAALGVQLATGRPFQVNEQGVVISYSFWQRRLRGDRSILGKTLTIQGTAFTVLGVTAEEFAGTGLPPQAPDIWLSMSMQARVLPNVDWLHHSTARQWQILARRKPGASLQQASAELDTLGATLPLVNDKPMRLRAKTATFFQADSGEFETFTAISQILMVAVALVLLIGCVNLVNLLVARSAARERELAVRMALGASRLQLMRQLCTESLVLGILGGAAGFLFSTWASAWIGASILETLQRITGGMLTMDFSPDWRILVYTGLLSMLTGVAVGVWPAVRASRTDINAALKGDSSSMRAPQRRRWYGRNHLLTGQVAACLMLLAAAGLLFRGVWRSQSTDPGFEAKQVFLLGIDPRAIAATPAAQTALLHLVSDRLSELPEVASVAFAEHPPFLGHSSGTFQNNQRQDVRCLFNRVSDRYFETLGIPMLAGRTFMHSEMERPEPVAVVNEAAASVLWPGQDPLGRSVYPNEDLKHEMPSKSYTVVGVVKTVRSTYLSKADGPFLYFPKASMATDGLFLVRTRIAPERVMRRAVATLSAIAPNLPSQSFMVTVEQGPVQIQRLMAQAPALAASALGFLALVLAAVGVYGMVSYQVTQRTREIGIRMALGARSSDVIRMVLEQGLRSVIWGAGIGLIGVAGLSTLLSKLVVMPEAPDLTYGAGAFDPATFLGVLSVLCLAALVASYLPVRRATRVEPSVALRNE
jgi:predicted permease